MMTRRPARDAFTLIELLVVISIIGILMSLILPAVQKIRGTGPRLTAKSDIEQMSAACTHFKNKYGFYPPSSFTVPTTKNLADPNFVLLSQMFPRWMSSQPAGTSTSLTAATITGSQCLVYFLGGPLGTGWAVDVPFAPSPTATAKNTFMDFPPNRVAGGVFFDPWKTPYAYFASGPGGIYPNFQINQTNSPYYTAANFIPVTAPAAPGIAALSSGNKPVNPGGVQIVSAGENKTFGPGGAWAPGAGAYSNAQSPGGDDIANFNGGSMLGVPNN
jgi:prepilin-type N-terminal cleavage/methylation domain-containing protein